MEAFMRTTKKAFQRTRVLIMPLAVFFLCFVPAMGMQAQERTEILQRNIPEPLHQEGSSRVSDTLFDIHRSQLIEPENIDNLLENLSNGKPVVVYERVFRFGELQSGYDTSRISWEKGLFDSTALQISLFGVMDASQVVGDIRWLEFDDAFHVIRDIYLDSESAESLIGRSIPVELTTQAGKQSDRDAATPVPRITGISGKSYYDSGVTNGRITESCGTGYNTGLAVDTYLTRQNPPLFYPWTISGINFGSVRGTVKLGSMILPVSSWGPNSIATNPVLPYYSAPLCTTLTVTTSGNQSSTYAVNYVPAIWSRVYGQCVWFVALTRLNMGKLVSPTAYGGYNQITGTYVPMVGDQLAWHVGRYDHGAIIVSVSSPVSSPGGYITRQVTVSQYNIGCRNEPSTYTSSFQIQRLSNGQVRVTKYIQSSWYYLGSAFVYYR
jgi:surface antigen